MFIYDGTRNDMNIAGFKTTNIALKNTPQQNPKEFKTKTEKQAKENDGKTSSIINLIDEIDTTLYVINDKLDETPEIMLGKGMQGGVLTKEGLGRMKLPEIKAELKKRGIEFKQNDKKNNLLERLEVFLLNPDRVKEYQPEAEKREIETQTEQRYTYGPPLRIPPPPSSSVFLRKYNQDRYQEEEAGDEGSSSSGFEDFERDEEEEEEEEEDMKDDVSSSSGLEGLSQFEGLSSYDGSVLYDPRAKRSPSDDGGDDYDGDSSYNPAQNRRPTPSSRNDLNSNIMKLEEQVDRLSKLTKGINSFINFSNPVEVEKLNNSSKKIVDSSNGLKEH